MLLEYRDLEKLFVNKKGITGDFVYCTVTDQANVEQPKGLFVAVTEDSGQLSEAIKNGAVAAIWEKDRPLPRYTPNHFPVFFTEDTAEGVKVILQSYLEKLNGDPNKKMELTNFKMINKKLHNKNRESYDIAVMLKKIEDYLENDSKGERE